MSLIERADQHEFGQGCKQSADRSADKDRDEKRPPRLGPERLRDHPSEESTQSQERPVREVEHVHEAVDQTQARGDEKVEGPETDTGHQGQDDGAHEWASEDGAGLGSAGRSA